MTTALDAIDHLGDHGPDLAIELTMVLGRLHLVQPFNWRQWNVPAPSRAEIETLALGDCVRHITRIVRADRVEQGLLMAAARSGDLRALCERARQLSSGRRVPNVGGAKPAGN